MGVAGELHKEKMSSRAFRRLQGEVDVIKLPAISDDDDVEKDEQINPTLQQEAKRKAVNPFEMVSMILIDNYDYNGQPVGYYIYLNLCNQLLDEEDHSDQEEEEGKEEEEEVPRPPLSKIATPQQNKKKRKKKKKKTPAKEEPDRLPESEVTG